VALVVMVLVDGEASARAAWRWSTRW
jgi:hypothetical protein